MVSFGMAFVSCSDALEQEEIVVGRECSGTTLAVNLWNSFRNGVTRSSEKEFPAYYGGMYLDKGRLFVFVVDDNESVRNNLLSRCGGADFEIKSCEYSYLELRNVVDRLTDMMKNASIVEDFGFLGCALLDYDNKVEVWLEDCSSESVSKFKKSVCDEPFLVFKKSGSVRFEENIYSGSAIGNGSGWGSLAYRAKMNGQIGFVTSGHVMKQVGKYLFKEDNFTILGECKACSYSGTVDAAFCSLNSGFTAINQVQGDFFSLQPSTGVAFVGLNVNLGGKYNHSSGKVVSTYVTYKGYGGTVMSNGIASSYASQNGDSGGIVYDDGGYAVGVHVGSFSIDGATRGLSCPAEDVNRLFFLTMF